MDTLRKIDAAQQYLRQLAAYGSKDFSMPSSSFILAGVSMQSDRSLQKMALDFQSLIASRFSLKTAIGIDSSSGNENYLLACRACA